MSVARRRAALETVATAYQLELDEDAWLEEVLRAARPVIGRRLGAAAATFHVDGAGSCGLTRWATSGLDPGVMPILERQASSMSPAEVAGTYACGTVFEPGSRTAARITGEPIEVALRSRMGLLARDFGITENVAARAIDVSRRGLILFGFSDRLESVSDEDAHRWRRVMTHLLAGLRLRFAAGSVAEAVLDPSGRVVHAEGKARAATARESLQRAAVELDRARSRAGTREPDAALEAWKGLVAGRWSLVDRFERDGRRFLVARPNDPVLAGHNGLTERERQVASYAALGWTNKEIAYTLGLAASTVSNHLRAAMRTLGARRRSDLASLGLGAVVSSESGGRHDADAPGPDHSRCKDILST